MRLLLFVLAILLFLLSYVAFKGKGAWSLLGGILGVVVVCATAMLARKMVPATA